jgi:plastocyanin
MTRGIVVAVAVAGIATAVASCGSTYDDKPTNAAVTPATNAGATVAPASPSPSPSGGGTTPLAAPADANPPVPAGPAATPTIESGVQVFTVAGTKEVTFSPAFLAAKPGRIRVDYMVESASPPHDFVVPMIPTAQTDVLSPGEKTSLTFTVNTKGTYQFVCTVHPSMKGVLKVS